MPLATVKFAPGFDKQSTAYGAEGKSIAEVFDEFEQGEVWRVDILEDNVKINPKPIYDYSKLKEVE